jgi:hypothetical protein
LTKANIFPGKAVFRARDMSRSTLKMKGGYLTLYSRDRSEIYGEIAGASWNEEETDHGRNHLLSGTAGEGTMETLRQVIASGIDHVAFDFDAEGAVYRGQATLLRPQEAQSPGSAIVTIETPVAPQAAGA